MILWYGIEKEGEYAGYKTLFIGSPKLTYKEITNIFDDYDIEQIYFGAGICTNINEKVLEECITTLPDEILISAEIDINDLHKYNIELLKKINVIITATHNNYKLLRYLKPLQTSIKIQTLNSDDNFLASGLYHWMTETNLDELQGKTYEGDIVLK